MLVYYIIELTIATYVYTYVAIAVGPVGEFYLVKLVRLI